MTRFALLSLLIAIAAPVFADETRTASCMATTTIVSDAVAMRLKGKAQDEVAMALEAGDLDRKYIATVQPLVDWVYTLPQDQLSGEIATAYNTACLTQLN